MIDQITYYILAITPAITALAGMIAAVGVLISNIKKIFAKTDTEVQTMKSQLKEQGENINKVLSENAELKRENRKLKTRLYHILDKNNEEK